jgi:hypothetical protein
MDGVTFNSHDEACSEKPIQPACSIAVRAQGENIGSITYFLSNTTAGNSQKQPPGQLKSVGQLLYGYQNSHAIEPLQLKA